MQNKMKRRSKNTRTLPNIKQEEPAIDLNLYKAAPSTDSGKNISKYQLPDFDSNGNDCSGNKLLKKTENDQTQSNSTLRNTGEICSKISKEIESAEIEVKQEFKIKHETLANANSGNFFINRTKCMSIDAL